MNVSIASNAHGPKEQTFAETFNAALSSSYLSTGGNGVEDQTIRSDKDAGDMDRNMPEDGRTASDRGRPRSQGRMDTDYMENNKEERRFPRTHHSTVEDNTQESRRLRRRLMFRHSLRRPEVKRLAQRATESASCLIVSCRSLR
jgi:hypothetical protein